MRARTTVWSLIGTTLLATACSTLQPIDESSFAGPDEAPETLAFRDDDPLLTVAMVRPATWDPAQLSMTDQGAVILADLLFDGLTQIGAGGDLEPGLATSWTVSDDGLVWTFALDLDRTTVADVVAGLERLRLASSDSPAAQLLFEVDRIEPVDQASVRFVLRTPRAGLDWILSGVPYSIVPSDGSTTGPFSPAVQSDLGWRLWSSATPEQPAGAGGAIEVVWVDDVATAARAFDEGEVDAAVLGDGAAPTVPTRETAGARSAVRFYGLSPSAPMFADVRVRQAVVAAVDRSGLVAELAGSAPTGGVFEADGLVAPTMAGYTGDACGGACGHDPGRAAALLAEVGPIGPIRIGSVGDAQAAVSARLAEQLRSVGLEATVVPLTAETFADAVVAGDVELYSWGWVAPAGSIDAVVPALLAGDGVANPTRMSSMVEIDQLVTQAMIEHDDAARWALLQSAQRQSLQAGWLIPVAMAGSDLVTTPGIDGVIVRADGSIAVRTLS